MGPAWPVQPPVAADEQAFAAVAAVAAAAVAVATVTWKFRLTFRPGNYIWSLSLCIWTQMRHLGTLIPRFMHRISIPFIWTKWFGLGSQF